MPTPRPMCEKLAKVVSDRVYLRIVGHASYFPNPNNIHVTGTNAREPNHLPAKITGGFAARRPAAAEHRLRVAS